MAASLGYGCEQRSRAVVRMLESVLLRPPQIEPKDGSLFCLAVSLSSRRATLVSARCQNEAHAFEHRYNRPDAACLAAVDLARQSRRRDCG